MPKHQSSQTEIGKSKYSSNVTRVLLHSFPVQKLASKREVFNEIRPNSVDHENLDVINMTIRKQTA